MTSNKEAELRDLLHRIKNADTDYDALEFLKAYTQQRELEAEKRGAAFAIRIIDDLHIGTEYSDTTDRLLKGLKNVIRNRFEDETGSDPAPNYPIPLESIKPQLLNNKGEK